MSLKTRTEIEACGSGEEAEDNPLRQETWEKGLGYKNAWGEGLGMDAS